MTILYMFMLFYYDFLKSWLTGFLQNKGVCSALKKSLTFL